MIRRLAIALAAVLAIAWPALSQEDDEGRLVRWIEEALSDGAARQIDLQGFRGALRAQASLDVLTVADAQGVWLRIEGAELNWNRAAVLRGEIDIRALAAERVVITRLPQADTGLPAPEATPFALPDLPVSIDIDEAAIDRIELGEDVLGQAAALSAEASVTLAGGAAEANVALARLDGPQGLFTIDTAFANDTRILSLDVAAEEAAGGLAVTLLNMTGAPPLELQISGAGPLDDFGADFSLATDRIDRIAGNVQITTEPDDAGDATLYSLDVAGDLAALVSGPAAPFFGDTSRLAAQARQAPSGAFELEALTLQTAALDLTGAMRLDPNFQPLAFDVSGTLVSPDPGAARVTLPGGAAQIGRADLALSYDRARGETLAAEASIADLRADAFQAASARLVFDGAIATVGDRIAGVEGALSVAAAGIGHRDPGIAEALGPRAQITGDLGWALDSPIRLNALRVETDRGTFLGDISVDPGAARVDVMADLAARIGDLSPFSGIAGQNLGGAAEADIALVGEALSGAFEIAIDARTRDVRAGDVLPPGLLAGTTDITGTVIRDETGIALNDFAIDGAVLSAQADGRVSSVAADLQIAARLAESSVIDPGLDGPITFSGQVLREGADSPFLIPDLQLTASFGEIAGAAQIHPSPDSTEISAAATAVLRDLAPLSGVVGQPLAGSAQLEIEATADTISGDFGLSAQGQTVDLQVGTFAPPGLFAGLTEMRADIARVDGRIDVEGVTIAGTEMTAEARGVIDQQAGDITISAGLRDASLLTPALPGPASIAARLVRSGATPWQVGATASGPGGMAASAEGEIGRPDGSVALDIAGTAPLALANRFIAPRNLTGQAAFDLQVEGPPGLRALSGRITASDARLSAPTFAFALEDLDLGAEISAGRAVLRATGRASTGGALGAEGSIDLAAPDLPADLTIRADGLRLVDPSLYEAVIAQAALSLTGPLTGGAFLAGDVTLGQVDIRVPDGGLGGAEAIPEIAHQGETAAERRTRAHAGLLGGPAGTGAGAGGGPAGIGLDIRINAPGQIFLRGRGLDAELGGTLRLGGTTAAVVTSSQFELIRGRLSALGQRFDLTRGTVSILGGDPYIDLTAEALAGEYTVFITIIGLVSAPEVRFSSTPELPEDEVLAQLFFGRSTASLSPIQALQLADAVAALAGGGSGVFTRLREGLGLDNLDIRTDDEGNAAVTAGRYLSDNVYSDVILDDEGTGVSLNIDLTPSITARGGVSSSGESTLGIFYERDY